MVGLPTPTSNRHVTGKSPFTSSSFEATLNKTEFLPSGEMRVTFIVPDSEADEAVKMRHAYACSLKVSVERLVNARK